MKRRGRIALGIAGGIVVAILAGLLIANWKYEFLWAAPPASHYDLVSQDTCAQLVIRPDKALKHIPNLLPNAKIPPSILAKIVPYEIAVLGTAEAGAESVGVTVFVNDRRLGPLIRNSASAAAFRGAFPSVTWSSETMRRDTRGKLTLAGTMPVEKSTIDVVREHWSALASFNQPLVVEKQHLIELALDNRSGGAFTVLASLPPVGSPGRAAFRDENTLKLIAGVSIARITADLAEGNSATIDVDIQTNPQANMIFAIKLLLDAAIPQINESLIRNYSASLEGKSTTEGDAIAGRYVLSHVDRILSGAGGAGAK